MNLQQLISQPDLNKNMFISVLSEHYPNEDPEVFFDIMEKLFQEEDVIDNPDRQIAIEYYMEETEDDIYEFMDVGLDVVSENKHYSLSFIPWKEILGYGVDNALAKYEGQSQLSQEEIIAHILVEMTFYGYDAESIDKQCEELTQRVEELDKIKQEDPDFLDKTPGISFDEVIEMLRKETEDDEHS